MCTMCHNFFWQVILWTSLLVNFRKKKKKKFYLKNLMSFLFLFKIIVHKKLYHKLLKENFIISWAFFYDEKQLFILIRYKIQPQLSSPIWKQNRNLIWKIIFIDNYYIMEVLMTLFLKILKVLNTFAYLFIKYQLSSNIFIDRTFIFLYYYHVIHIKISWLWIEFYG